MNEQNKKDAEYLRELAREKKNIDWVRLRAIAEHIDPKPEHPVDMEVVEVKSKSTGLTHVGYAGEDLVYGDKARSIRRIRWDSAELLRILPDPDKCIVIEKIDNWDYVIVFDDSDNVLKCIRREELEAK